MEGIGGKEKKEPDSKMLHKGNFKRGGGNDGAGYLINNLFGFCDRQVGNAYYL